MAGCLEAVVKESQGFFFKSYGAQATFKIYDPSAINTAKFWDGTGVPLFVENSVSAVSNILGFHDNNYPGNFIGTGINPLPNFPYSYPWIYISYIEATNSAIKNANNPYSFQNADDFLCPIISHEIFEVIGDDDTNHYRYFDNKAPAMQYVYFAKKLADGTYDPTGYTIDSNGIAHFPKLTDVFPKFLAFVIEEAGDPVSRGACSKFNSFPLGRYNLTNYPTRQSFNCYDTTEQVWDRMGHMQHPCVPYGGRHETIYFTDLTQGITYKAQLDNYGPLNATQVNHIYGYKYPPFSSNTPFLSFRETLTGTNSMVMATNTDEVFSNDKNIYRE